MIRYEGVNYDITNERYYAEIYFEDQFIASCYRTDEGEKFIEIYCDKKDFLKVDFEDFMKNLNCLYSEFQALES